MTLYWVMDTYQPIDSSRCQTYLIAAACNRTFLLFPSSWKGDKRNCHTKATRHQEDDTKRGSPSYCPISGMVALLQECRRLEYLKNEVKKRLWTIFISFDYAELAVATYDKCFHPTKLFKLKQKLLSILQSLGLKAK